MKTLSKTLSAVASTTLLAGSVLAANATAPSQTTVDAVTQVVGGYQQALALPAATARTTVAHLTLYPTADRNVVFVSFQTNEASRAVEHVGLVETSAGQVTRFTDFSGTSPQEVKTVLAAVREDAQMQARALLAPANPEAVTTAVATSSVRLTAQSQAADLLRAAPLTSPSRTPARLARVTPAVTGDSQAMARTVLTFARAQ